ncbi:MULTISPECIES: hypothetical protein [unclassified Pseudoclavibacter]|uniref:hypothetical protein n=1 Tax=unclassified Pseudoclavibacter TaxID=2615177 RepID=UPI001BA94E00|nr:hypothetical protein [Pseudoclavibacter sp. Marseille-Q4354]MBS3177769.1 hypothetical protein [Pseudoclavibacter sp. Marseille-Q4354]
MSLAELPSLTDDQLDDLRIAAATEQERRARMRQVPLDIAASAKRFVEDGGDPEEIRAALTDTLPVVEIAGVV